MHNNQQPRVTPSRALIMSSLLAAILVSACNDSNASTQSNNVANTPLATSSMADEVSALVKSSSKIEERNHVCFTMDVNNVKCVLGDTVAYVPQPIIKEEPKEEVKKTDSKKNSKSKDKEKKEEVKTEVDPVLQAKQDALNEARPLIFVARYCDMDKPVVYSKEGVACTFKPHALYDAGPVAEVTQYQMNVINTKAFFAELQKIPGVEKFTSDSFGENGGYRIFLKHGADKNGLKISKDTSAVIFTKRIDREGNVLGFYTEELNFANLNPQMRILTEGLVAGDHVKLVFDTTLPNEQPLWRTSSLEFGQPYIWEVEVISVSTAKQPAGEAPVTDTTQK